jgi:hypothetical protein
LHYYFIMRTLRQIQKKLNGEDEWNKCMLICRLSWMNLWSF